MRAVLVDAQLTRQRTSTGRTLRDVRGADDVVGVARRDALRERDTEVDGGSEVAVEAAAPGRVLPRLGLAGGQRRREREALARIAFAPAGPCAPDGPTGPTAPAGS